MKQRNINPDMEVFHWHRPERGGYEWVSAKVAGMFKLNANRHVENETRFLDIEKESEHKFFYYHPLTDEPQMFRTFAALAPSEESFLSFANKYGDLGIGVMIVRDDAWHPSPSDPTKKQATSELTRHDPFYAWEQAQRKLSEVVDVVTAVNDRDVATLQKWFSITDGAIKYAREDEKVPGHFSIVTMADQMRSYIWNWANEAESQDAMILRGAIGFAQQEINSAVSGDNASRSTMRVVFDADAKEMIMRVCPTTLLGAMWLQVARALTENPPLKQCENCGRWFELASEAKRSTTRFCSSKCKVAWHRKNPKAKK